jgi:hypothetical protein
MYGVIMEVPAPIELYDRIHPEVMRSAREREFEGLLIHIGRATSQGFEMIEVWESQEQFERYVQEIVDPVAAQVVSEGPVPSARETVKEFDVHGLVIRPGQILRHADVSW